MPKRAPIEKYKGAIYRPVCPARLAEDHELTAYSTLPPSDGENLVKIYSLKEGLYANREEVRLRTWAHDILDDNNIPYRIEILGKWIARRKFRETQMIYVEEKNKKKARRLIRKFKNANDILPEHIHENDVDDVDDASEDAENLPQIKCPACNKEIDFDYHKCPECGKRLQPEGW